MSQTSVNLTQEGSTKAALNVGAETVHDSNTNSQASSTYRNKEGWNNSTDGNVTPPSSQDEAPVTVELAPLRKWTILFLLCFSQFWDIVNVTAPTIGLPDIAADLDMGPSQRPWVVSAYALSFAGLLLLCGRLSDMIGAKITFCIGYFVLGIAAIIAAVAPDAIVHLVFRAIQGIGAALTIPSAMSLIAAHFQGKLFTVAFGIFAAAGCIGNVLGVIIGGVITAYVPWQWIFYVTAICVIPAGIASIFVLVHVPPQQKFTWARLDVPGVTTGTFGIILLTFAFAGASTYGWASATILAPLLISIALLLCFVWVEHKVKYPVIPPSLFSLQFSVLVGVAFSLYFWFNSLVYQTSYLFENVFQWTPIQTAVHFLPLGFMGLLASFSSGFVIKYVPVRYTMPVCQLLMVAGALLMSFARDSGDYARLIVPGFLIGNLGMASCFAPVNISLMELCPSGMEGVVGAIFNSAVQVGSGIGIAILALASDSIQPKYITPERIAAAGGDTALAERQALAIGIGQSYYILVAFSALLILLVLATTTFRHRKPETNEDVESQEKRRPVAAA
ncbi:mfs general substrate transporter [Ceraceosorus bombacis]|uniref:Mfs general substrate transporter n=1 Tax=Ceraceosorus bombacis TaxID=401625 RepID=A0A0P1BNS2_9BASI|nr:mfs general substrate transporter [Ceraceosorus bombacis]